MTVISHFLSPYRLDSSIDRSIRTKQSEQEDKYIEKLANAIGKKISKALDRFETNQVYNALFAKMRAYEENRYKTNNQHCCSCYQVQNKISLQLDKSISKYSNVIDYVDISYMSSDVDDSPNNSAHTISPRYNMPRRPLSPVNYESFYLTRSVMSYPSVNKMI